jgi:hypothetical protein
VQSTSPPVKSGFVPADYLQTVTTTGGPQASASAVGGRSAAAAGSPASPAHAGGHSFDSPAGAASAAQESSFLSRLGGGGGAAAAPGLSPGSLGASRYSAAAAAAASSSSSSASSSAAAEEFGQLFASHEEWFRAATAKRKEVYGQLLAEAGDIARALSETEARSLAVLGRVHELEKVINEEKGRWTQKLAEDSALSAQA